MAASQVVLYFEKQEDALQFTLAASSVMAAEVCPARGQDALPSIAREIRKASRITTEGVVESLTLESPNLAEMRSVQQCA